MRTACLLVGVEVPERDAAKVSCPFGALYHPDRGTEAALRVYRDHAWCFAEQEYFSPCRLTAMVWDCTQDDAALRLLDSIGYKPVSYAQHWQNATREPHLDAVALAQALRTYCSRLPGWDYLQLEAGPAEYLARCLGFLSRVNTIQEAERWLGLSKQVMSAIVRRQHGYPGAPAGGLAYAVRTSGEARLHPSGSQLPSRASKD